MPDKWDSYIRSEASSVPQDDTWSKYARKENANVVDEQHPEVPRTYVMNLAPNSRAAAQYLREKGFEVKELGADYDFNVRRPGEKVWRKLDPTGFDWKDITDIGTDIGKGVAAGVGGTMAGGAALATGPGAVAAGAGGAALGSGLAESAKQGLGRLLGFKQTGGEALRDIGVETALGGISEGALRGVASAAKPIFKKLGTANPLRMPYALERAITGSDKEIAAREASNAVKVAAEDLAKARLAAMPETSSVVSGTEVAMRLPPQAAERIAPKVAGEGWIRQAERATPENIERAFSSTETPAFRMISDVVHPAFGVKAANLQYVPGLRKIWQEELGHGFRNVIGSESMANADRYLQGLAMGKTAQEVDDIAKSLAKRTGEWMRENLKVLSDAEQKATANLIAGQGTSTDAKVASNAIMNAIAEPIEKIRPYKETLIRRRLERDIAQGERAKGTKFSNEMDRYFTGVGGRELRKWLGLGWGGTIGAGTRAADVAGRVAEAVLQHSAPKGIRIAGAPYAKRVIPNQVMRAILAGGNQ